MSWDDGWTVSTNGAYRIYVSNSTATATVNSAWYGACVADCAANYPDPIAEARRIEREDQARREAALRAQGWKEAEWPRRLAEAEARAAKLLRRFLTPEQRTALEMDRAFDVRAPSGTVYRLRWGTMRNVLRLSGRGHPVEQLCLHPVGWVPTGDVLLTQKLLLERQEAEFLRQANRSALSVPWR